MSFFLPAKHRNDSGQLSMEMGPRNWGLFPAHHSAQRERAASRKGPRFLSKTTPLVGRVRLHQFRGYLRAWTVILAGITTGLCVGTLVTMMSRL